MRKQCGATDPENENPGTLAGATGAAFESGEARWQDNGRHIAPSIPHRHVLAFVAQHKWLTLLRRGHDFTDVLAAELREHLGPNECRMLADAAGAAYRAHHWVEL